MVDLLLDLPGQIVDIVNSETARIHKLEVILLFLQQMGHAVSGYTGDIIHNGQPTAGKPVEDAGLADVGSTDNDYLGNSHGMCQRLCVSHAMKSWPDMRRLTATASRGVTVSTLSYSTQRCKKSGVLVAVLEGR